MIVDKINITLEEIEIIKDYLEVLDFELPNKHEALFHIATFLIYNELEVDRENLNDLDLSDYLTQCIVRNENKVEMGFFTEEEVNIQRFNFIGCYIEDEFERLRLYVQESLDYEKFKILLRETLIEDDVFEDESEFPVIELFKRYNFNRYMYLKQ